MSDAPHPMDVVLGADGKPVPYVNLEEHMAALRRAGGHLFTLAEAGRAAGVSKDTIKRRKAAGSFPNATKDERGVWLVPLADLIAAGLSPVHSAPSPAPLREASAPAAQDAVIAALEARVADLVSERDRYARLLESALQRLPSALPPGAPITAPPVVPEAAAPPSAPPAPPRRSLWKRITG